jgi:hypothetical protein
VRKWIRKLAPISRSKKRAQTGSLKSFLSTLPTAKPNREAALDRVLDESVGGNSAPLQLEQTRVPSGEDEPQDVQYIVFSLVNGRKPVRDYRSSVEM